MNIIITLLVIYLIWALYKLANIQIENINDKVIIFFNDFKLNRKHIIIWK